MQASKDTNYSAFYQGKKKIRLTLQEDQKEYMTLLLAVKNAELALLAWKEEKAKALRVPKGVMRVYLGVPQTCIICYEVQAEYGFKKCRHISFCLPCSQKLKKCAICNL